jgi:3-hydroxyisobutyrate dehydrogenase-like beta-hydroxyacid dehydrogenase
VLGTPTRIGENGQGLVLKLAINISLAVQTLALKDCFWPNTKGSTSTSPRG